MTTTIQALDPSSAAAAGTGGGAGAGGGAGGGAGAGAGTPIEGSISARQAAVLAHAVTVAGFAPGATTGDRIIFMHHDRGCSETNRAV
jgi:hypothetical protein